MLLLSGLPLLLLPLFASAAVKKMFFPANGTISLTPPVSGALSSVNWRSKGDLVVEWDGPGNEPKYFGKFQTRTSLNMHTGLLEVRRATADDGGSYTVEVNLTRLDVTFEVAVIKQVPRPTAKLLTLACSPQSERCNLVCDADVTEAGPVTYSWMKKGGAWSSELAGVDYAMTKNEEPEKEGETITCRIRNPISVEESEAITNPFYEKPDYSKLVAGLVSLVVIILIIGVLVFLWCKYREAIKQHLCPDPAPAPSPAEVVPLSSNGGSPANVSAHEK